MRWKSWDIILHPHQIAEFRILCEKHILEFMKIAFGPLKLARSSEQFEGCTFYRNHTQRINVPDPCIIRICGKRTARIRQNSRNSGLFTALSKNLPERKQRERIAPFALLKSVSGQTAPNRPDQ
jgi:hypothetical protein